jgi:hypothetical protein
VCVRVSLGRDHQTRKRRSHNHTVHGPVSRTQEYLTKTLRDRDLGRGLEGAETTLDSYLTRWLDTAAKPKLREKSCQSYESLLRRYIRPVLGQRILSTITPLDVQDIYQKMMDRGRTAAPLPRLGRREMRVLTAEQSKRFLSVALKTHYGPVFFDRSLQPACAQANTLACSGMASIGTAVL